MKNFTLKVAATALACSLALPAFALDKNNTYAAWCTNAQLTEQQFDSAVAGDSNQPLIGVYTGAWENGHGRPHTLVVFYDQDIGGLNFVYGNGYEKVCYSNEAGVMQITPNGATIDFGPYGNVTYVLNRSGVQGTYRQQGVATLNDNFARTSE